MTVICCVCKRTIRETREDESVKSHTWCPSCLKLFRVRNGLKNSRSKVRQ